MKGQSKIMVLVLKLVIISLLFGITVNAEEFKLMSPNPAVGDSLGFNVDIDGDYAIVGSPSKDSSGLGNDVGKAYIYFRSGASWDLQDSLTASDASPLDNFGYSVAINGDYAIVGAPFWDSTGASNFTDAGKVFVYMRSGTDWNEQAVLIASNPRTNQNFGWSVDLDGAYAVIGAPFDDQIANRAGAAYTFLRTGSSWSQQTKLLGVGQEGNDRLGYDVSISGDWVVTGAYYDDDSGRNAGAAYFFQRSGVTWNEQDKVTPTIDDSLHFFGLSVSIDGDYSIIGAPAPNADPADPGSAYIFNRSGTNWNLQQQISASDGLDRDWFGNSVSISGDYVVVGAPKDDTVPPPVNDHGSIYSFLRSGAQWNQKAKITASDFLAGDEFGYSVAIDNNYSIVGIPKQDSTGIGVDVGNAYIYHSIDDLALPVTLISFEAVANINSILLKWTTASEIANQGFILNRYIENENNYITIASYLNDQSLVGAGNSSSLNEYSFEDKSAISGNTYTYNLISVSINGELEDLGYIKISAGELNNPENIVLYSNYPNPFNPKTNFRVFVPDNINEKTDYSLVIYNSNGQKVKTIYIGNITEGFHTFYWNGISDIGSHVSSGIYYAVLNYGEINQVIKMSLVK
jgi:hypothetical protein